MRAELDQKPRASLEVRSIESLDHKSRQAQTRNLDKQEPPSDHKSPEKHSDALQSAAKQLLESKAILADLKIRKVFVSR